MVETYPEGMKTFKVVGRFVRGTEDSGDPNQEPDVIPLEGIKVFFTPRLNPAIFRWTEPPIPMTVFLETVEATTDSDGYLKTNEDPQRGVVLPYGQSEGINPTGWTWGVRIEAGGSFKPYEFDIAGAPDGEVDLASVLRVPDQKGIDVQHWLTVAENAKATAEEAQQLLDSINTDFDPPNKWFSGTDRIIKTTGGTGEFEIKNESIDLTGDYYIRFLRIGRSIQIDYKFKVLVKSFVEFDLPIEYKNQLSDRNTIHNLNSMGIVESKGPFFGNTTIYLQRTGTSSKPFVRINRGNTMEGDVVTGRAVGFIPLEVFKRFPDDMEDI